MAEIRRWSTPQALFDKLHAEFRFDVDLCADSDNWKLPNFILADQALAKPWCGVRGWLNPPYGKTVGEWLAKAKDSALRAESLIVVLVPGRTNAPWWHDHVMKAAEVRFIRRKVPFVDHDDRNSGVPPYGSAIAIYQPFSQRAYSGTYFTSWDYRL